MVKKLHKLQNQTNEPMDKELQKYLESLNWFPLVRL